jgi:hypothetical protein
MEELEFWVSLGKKLGIGSDNFQEIKEISLRNYKNIQDRLNETQTCLRNKLIRSQSDINQIENYLTRLAKAVTAQEKIIMLKCLSLLFSTLEAEIQGTMKRSRIKSLVIICKKVKKRLNTIQGPIDHLISPAVQELSNFQYTLLAKL